MYIYVSACTCLCVCDRAVVKNYHLTYCSMYSMLLQMYIYRFRCKYSYHTSEYYEPLTNLEGPFWSSLAAATSSSGTSDRSAVRLSLFAWPLR